MLLNLAEMAAFGVKIHPTRGQKGKQGLNDHERV